MAIPIKAIPTLYGEEAARLRRKIDEAESRFLNSPVKDITKEPGFLMMRSIIEKSENNQHLFLYSYCGCEKRT